jgi:hypothetical protein
VFESEHFGCPHFAEFSVVTFSYDGYNCRFPNSYCDAQFTCRSSRIRVSTLSSVSIVAVAAGWPLRDLSVSYLRFMTDTAPDLTSVASSLYTLLRRL